MKSRKKSVLIKNTVMGHKILSYFQIKKNNK